jgi:hypothetical protein
MGVNRDCPDRARRLAVARRLSEMGWTHRDAREEYPDLWPDTEAARRRWRRDVIDSRKQPRRPRNCGEVIRGALCAIAREVGPVHLPTAARVIGCTVSGARKVAIALHARRVYRASLGGWVWVLPKDVTAPAPPPS